MAHGTDHDKITSPEAPDLTPGQEKVPHAGRLPAELGGERPVRIFPESLEEADARKLVHPVPPDASQLLETKRGWLRPLAIGAFGALGVGVAIFGLTRGSDKDQTAVAVATTEKDPSTTETTYPPLELFPSYTEKFEPEPVTGPGAETITSQLRKDFYYAIVARKDPLREQYINYMVNDDPELATILLDILTDARAAYAFSGLSEEEYFDQQMDTWEPTAESVVGDETLRLAILHTDPTVGESALVNWDVRMIEDTKSPTGKRFIVTGYQRVE